MILLQCVTAYVAVQQMMEKEWDYQAAYGLLQLKQKLQSHVDFYAREEMELVRICGIKDGEGHVDIREDGKFDFVSAAAAANFAQRRRELGAVEVTPDWDVVRISRPEKIKPAQLEALAGFVEFIE